MNVAEELAILVALLILIEVELGYRKLVSDVSLRQNDCSSWGEEVPTLVGRSVCRPLRMYRPSSTSSSSSADSRSDPWPRVRLGRGRIGIDRHPGARTMWLPCRGRGKRGGNRPRRGWDDHLVVILSVLSARSSSICFLNGRASCIQEEYAGCACKIVRQGIVCQSPTQLMLRQNALSPCLPHVVFDRRMAIPFVESSTQMLSLA